MREEERSTEGAPTTRLQHSATARLGCSVAWTAVVRRAGAAPGSAGQSMRSRYAMDTSGAMPRIETQSSQRDSPPICR